MTHTAELLNLIQREVDRAARRYMPGHRFGLVSQYDPSGPSVRVTFPDDLDASGNPTLSPWMPIIQPASSANAGDIAAPLVGSQAIILHFGWGADRFTFMLGTVRGGPDKVPFMPVDSGTPPVGIPEGDRAIVHPTGTGLFLRGDGAVLVGNGSGTFKKLATEDFVYGVFNPHTHEYMPGSGSPTQTQPPQTQVASGDTTNLTAQLKGT